MEYLRIQEVSAFIGQMDQSSKLPQNTLEVRSALSCLLFSTLVLEVLANLIKGEEINGILIGKKEMKMGEARIRIQALPPTPSAKSRAAVPSLLKQTGNPCSGLFPCPGQARPHSPTPPAALRENRHVPRGPKGGCFLSPTQLSGAL